MNRIAFEIFSTSNRLLLLKELSVSGKLCWLGVSCCLPRRNLVRNATVQQITNVAWKKDGQLIDLQTQERIRWGPSLDIRIISSEKQAFHVYLV